MYFSDFGFSQLLKGVEHEVLYGVSCFVVRIFSLRSD